MAWYLVKRSHNFSFNFMYLPSPYLQFLPLNSRKIHFRLTEFSRNQDFKRTHSFGSMSVCFISFIHSTTDPFQFYISMIHFTWNKEFWGSNINYRTTFTY